MADDRLDEALRARLGRLLAAVPVDKAADRLPDAAAGTGALPRPRVVARTLLGLTSVTIALVAIVVGVLAFSQRPSIGGPVTAVATDGPFKLTLTIPKASYAAGEPITGVSAAIEYMGSDGSVTISSDRQLIFFSLAEVGGTRHLGGISDLMCGSVVLKSGEPLTKPYTKSGGSFGEDPDYPWFSAMFARPELALDAGRWTFTASIGISFGGCQGPTTYNLSTSITISVGDAATASSAVGTAATSSPMGAVDDGPAAWWVDPADLPLRADATVVHGFVQEQSCASGRSPEGRLVGPTIDVRPDAVVITYRVRLISGGTATCQSNPALPVVIELGQPLGTRHVIDGWDNRDATLDPTNPIGPSEDCGPLVGTEDAKIACLAMINATVADRYASYQLIWIRPNDLACGPGECTDTASIEARAWSVQAIARSGSSAAWVCAYRDGVATCAPPQSPPPG